MNKIRIEVIKKTDSALDKDIQNLALELSDKTEKSKVTKRIKDILNYPNSSFIAAFDKRKIAGMVILIVYPLIEGYKKGWIEGLVVDKNYRGKGIGENLMKKVLKEAEKKGLKTVNLTSRKERVAATSLYKKMGFKKVKTNVYRINLN